jgi:ABC-type spermidine/putrescine transport system permease subunit I
MTLYYVLPEGSSFVVVLATALMALFLLESMILFFITFLFFSDKVMEILRWRFSGKFGWKVAFQLFWRYFWRFLLIIAIATILAALLVSMAYWLTSTLGRAENPNFLLLLTVPLLLMHFGLNLGLLLFQCYRLMFSLGRARVKNDAALLGVTIV